MPTSKTPIAKRRVAVQIAARGAPSPRLLARFARAATRADIALRVVGASEGKRLNRFFRKKNDATNVLSFAYGRGAGDVVLCHPVIVREAREQGKTLRAHYAHLIVHGALHLRGHDHMRKKDAVRMERAEIRILRGLGFGDPYALK